MAFTDYASGQSRVVQGNRLTTLTGDAWTAGLDISFVFNFLRLRAPLEAGVRAIRNIRTGELIVQPLVIDIGL